MFAVVVVLWPFCVGALLTKHCCASTSCTIGILRQQSRPVTELILNPQSPRLLEPALQRSRKGSLLK